MSEVSLNIGQRVFRVVCVDGQEAELQHAAGLLDELAASLIKENQSISETQLLLMASLMVADRARASEGENKNLQAYQKDLEARLTKVEEAAGSRDVDALDELKISLETAKSEVKALKTKIERESEKADKEADALKDNISKLKSENQALEKQLNGASDGNVELELRQNLKEKINENKALRAQVEQVTMGLPDVESVERSDNEDKLATLQLQISDLKAENKILKQAQAKNPKGTSNGELSSEDAMGQLLQGLERLAKD